MRSEVSQAHKTDGVRRNSTHPITCVVSLNLFRWLIGGEKVLFQVAGPDALETDKPFLVDNKVRPLDTAARFVEYTKGLHNLLVLRITEKGIIQLEKIREGLLRKGRIGAYP